MKHEEPKTLIQAEHDAQTEALRRAKAKHAREIRIALRYGIDPTEHEDLEKALNAQRKEIHRALREGLSDADYASLMKEFTKIPTK